MCFRLYRPRDSTSQGSPHMLKKIAAAIVVASLVPAVALACGKHTKAKQEQAKQAQSQPVTVAQLNMKDLKKMGDNAGSQIKKDADKVQLDKKLEGASPDSSKKSAVKKRPNANQVSQPKK